MTLRLLKQTRDHATLVLAGNRGVPPIAQRKPDDALFHLPAGMVVDQPFSKERRTDVSRRNTRPIEELFGYEMVARGMALGFQPCRSLGHIDDRFDTSFAGRLGKKGR